jgi:hypothetical protein
MCKQEQECGTPTSGKHFNKRTNECHWLIDVKTCCLPSLESAGVSYSVVVFLSLVCDNLDTGAGTNLDSTNCSTNATGSYDPCYAAFLSLHLTPSSTAYFEVGFI